MLQAFVITLREGLEAFLIVAISLSYLRQSGRLSLTAAVHWGIAAAVGVSALGGYLLYHAANQETLDGPLALLPCVSQTAYRRCDECIDEMTCGIRSVMKEVRDRTAEILDGTSLEDLVMRSHRMLESGLPLMYHI